MQVEVSLRSHWTCAIDDDLGVSTDIAVPLERFDPHRNLEADRKQEYTWSGFKNCVEILEIDPNRFTRKYYYVEII